MRSDELKHREQKPVAYYHPSRVATPRAHAIAKPADGHPMRFMTWIMAALIAISALVLLPSIGAAQQDNTPAPSPTAGNVPGETKGTSSDSDLWRLLKSGGSGSVSNANPNAATAIQTNGMDWLHIRNDAFPMYAAWGLLGVIGLLAIFFGLRGRIRIGHGGPSGKTILRFKSIERVGHWLLASSFIVLALTGLNLVYGRSVIIPILGKEAFASITVYGKLIHNYVAFALMVALVWVVVTWVRYNIPHPRDIVWFLRGGGILGGGHPAAAKFNAGQKVLFWLTVLGGVILSLSGWALLFPFTTTFFADTFGAINSVLRTELPTTLTILQEQQLAQIVHGIMSVVLMMVVIAHIYIGSIGMEGALDAMRAGTVDRNWALEHHNLWVEEEDAKANDRATAPSIQPAE